VLKQRNSLTDAVDLESRNHGARDAYIGERITRIDAIYLHHTPNAATVVQLDFSIDEGKYYVKLNADLTIL